MSSLPADIVVVGNGMFGATAARHLADRGRQVITIGAPAVDPGDLEGIYMVPPVQYEDVRHYLKMGANTRFDDPLTGLAELQRWFNTDTDPHYLPLYEPALRALWPAIDFVSVRTQPCVITYTADRFPLIEHLGGGLFVATAGNGGGAKGSDAWGERAAGLVHDYVSTHGT